MSPVLIFSSAKLLFFFHHHLHTIVMKDRRQTELSVCLFQAKTSERHDYWSVDFSFCRLDYLVWQFSSSAILNNGKREDDKHFVQEIVIKESLQNILYYWLIIFHCKVILERDTSNRSNHSRHNDDEKVVSKFHGLFSSEESITRAEDICCVTHSDVILSWTKSNEKKNDNILKWSFFLSLWGE